MTTVTIRNLSNGSEYTSRHRTDDEHEALRRAITKHWGRRAFWHADSGLGWHYGQVFEPCGTAQASSRTPRCRVDFS